MDTNGKIYQRYLETSVYTYVGMYKEFVLSLPDDILSFGGLFGAVFITLFEGAFGLR